jgi:hypothetical protein
LPHIKLFWQDTKEQIGCVDVPDDQVPLVHTPIDLHLDGTAGPESVTVKEIERCEEGDHLIIYLARLN